MIVVVRLYQAEICRRAWRNSAPLARYGANFHELLTEYGRTVVISYLHHGCPLRRDVACRVYRSPRPSFLRMSERTPSPCVSDMYSCRPIPLDLVYMIPTGKVSKLASDSLAKNLIGTGSGASQQPKRVRLISYGVDGRLCEFEGNFIHREQLLKLLNKSRNVNE